MKGIQLEDFNMDFQGEKKLDRTPGLPPRGSPPLGADAMASAQAGVCFADLRLTLGKLRELLTSPTPIELKKKNSQEIISGISTDSRTTKPRELFFALMGPTFDGHNFLENAFQKGALAAVVSRPLGQESAKKSRKNLKPLFLVTDTLKALGDLARNLRDQRDLKVLAITGSVGKTTVKELVSLILGKKDPYLLKTIGNFNNLIGVPRSILEGISPRTQNAVLELGANNFGEIKRLTEIVNPSVGLITRVERAHLEFFGDLQGVWKAKSEMFWEMSINSTAVINLDDPYLAPWAEKFPGNTLTFGKDPLAAVRLVNRKPLGVAGEEISLIGPGLSKPIKIHLRLLGEAKVNCATAAAAAALAMGAEWSDIALGLEEARALPGRGETKVSPTGVSIINESYNANPGSMEAALTSLQGLEGGKIAILGDMLELGTDSPQKHWELGQFIAKSK
ncbi:MAG: UDP-N-acetylmuramoyl-tripeptide--D-alanyl-D-alanine ligase, partial [Deltaproteobacteria bacterium]|nr:UDP-N-acetylmuramoyl-tripeptide--D-alanyl-D-alanine ligase [Deltaproteobacteria bacterium]